MALDGACAALDSVDHIHTNISRGSASDGAVLHERYKAGKRYLLLTA